MAITQATIDQRYGLKAAMRRAEQAIEAYTLTSNPSPGVSNKADLACADVVAAMTAAQINTGAAAVSAPKVVFVGDSLMMFNNLNTALSGVTLTRNAQGVINVAKTNHGIYGSQPVYLANITDPSFEVFGYTTYVDANNFTIPSTVLSTATTTGLALGYASIINRNTMGGLWMWLASRLRGAAQLVANYGQGGDRLDEMTGAVAKAASQIADIAVINGGINDLNQSASAATIVARMQAHVDTLVASGKRVAIIGITPLGSAWPSTVAKKYVAQEANRGFAAIAAASAGKVVYVDAYTPLADPAYQGTAQDGRAYSWATYDGIHWTGRAARLIGANLYAAISGWVVPANGLPTSSSNLPVLAGFTAIKQYGPWSATGGGFNNTGSSGTVAPQFLVFPGASNTCVNSLVDRGGTDGYWQRQIITPGGVNGFNDYIASNNGESLTSLGLTATDEVMVVFEVSVQNAEAAGLKDLTANVNLQDELQGRAGTGGTIAAVTHIADSFEEVLVVGPMKLNAAGTTLRIKLGCGFFGATANTLQLDVGRVVLYKRTSS